MCVGLALTLGIGMVSSEVLGQDYRVRKYDLEVQVEPATQRIAGTQKMEIEALKPVQRLAVRLEESMTVKHVRQQGAFLGFSREGDSLWINLDNSLPKGTATQIEILYGGAPKTERTIWLEERAIFEAASLPAHHWWPCHPDPTHQVPSMRMAVITPDELALQTNAKYLFQTDRPGPFTRRQYEYPTPTTAADVALYVGDFEKLTDVYAGDNGTFDLSYLVPRAELSAGKTAMIQLQSSLNCLESQFGPYPFWKEGIHEVYQKPDAQDDREVAQTLAFNPELVKKLSRQWFGRSIQAKDALAESWLQAFVAYAEACIVACKYDEQAARRYLFDQPEVPAGGAWLFSLKGLVDEEWGWQMMIQNLVAEFEGQVVEGQQISRFLSEGIRMDIESQVAQYLLYQKPPELQYDVVKQKKRTFLYYRWEADAEDFQMQARFRIQGDPLIVNATTKWQKLEWKRMKPNQISPVEDWAWINVRRVERQ